MRVSPPDFFGEIFANANLLKTESTPARRYLYSIGDMYSGVQWCTEEPATRQWWSLSHTESIRTVTSPGRY